MPKDAAATLTMVPMQVSVSIVPSFFKKYSIRESSVEKQI